MPTSFFADLLHSIATPGRALLHRAQRSHADPSPESLINLCNELLSRRGEASGVAPARDVLTRFADLDPAARLAFFEALASQFGPDRAQLTAAVEAWQTVSGSWASQVTDHAPVHRSRGSIGRSMGDVFEHAKLAAPLSRFQLNGGVRRNLSSLWSLAEDGDLFNPSL